MRIAHLSILCVLTTGCRVTAARQPVTLRPIEWIRHESVGLNHWGYVAPDGETITYSRSVDGQSYDLLVTSRRGRPAQQFLKERPAPSLTRGAWSRVHRRLAFVGSEAGDVNTAVFVADSAGEQVARVPMEGASDRVMYPSWFPDGKNVVVVDYGSAGGSRLLRVDLQSGATEPLTNPAEVLVGMPSVSPDGQVIAFAGQLNARRTYDQLRNRIWLLPARGGRLTEVSAGQGRQPDWSPDGRWLAFTSSRGDTAGRQAVFIVKRNGGNLTQVTSYAANAQHPVWSPDGTWLLFSAESPDRKGVFGLAMVTVPIQLR